MYKLVVQTVEWTIVMEHWTGLLDWVIFLLWTSFCMYYWKRMTIVGHHSVFITKCKYTFDNTVYCKLPEVEKFCGFLVNWLATKNFSSIKILPAITLMQKRIWSRCNHECFEWIIAEFYNCGTFKQFGIYRKYLY